MGTGIAIGLVASIYLSLMLVFLLGLKKFLLSPPEGAIGVITGLSGKMSQSGGLKIVKGGTRKLRFPIIQRGWIVNTTWEPLSLKGLSVETIAGQSRLVDLSLRVALPEDPEATHRFVTLWGGIGSAEREQMLSEWLLSFTMRTIAHTTDRNLQESEITQLFKTELSETLQPLGLGLHQLELVLHPVRGSQKNAGDGEFTYNQFDIS